jgi:hypothetical protein
LPLEERGEGRVYRVAKVGQNFILLTHPKKLKTNIAEI